MIVGEGEERERLEGLARSLGLNDSVLFVGGQPREMVAMYLAAADVFLFPTERAESFGFVLAEAMASGLPVVASETGALREVIGRPGVNGLLVPPGNVDALANVMRMLLANEALRRRLGEAARRRVLAEYTVERMVEQTLEVYRFAIGRSGLLQLRSAVAMLPWVSLSIARAGRRATRVSALWSSKRFGIP